MRTEIYTRFFVARCPLPVARCPKSALSAGSGKREAEAKIEVLVAIPEF